MPFIAPKLTGARNIEHHRHFRASMEKTAAIPTDWQRSRNWWFAVQSNIGSSVTSTSSGKFSCWKFIKVINQTFLRLVATIGDTYGLALLLHMLTSTIMLTLLAYQATKIDTVSVYAFSVIGYLVYALAQVFLFCIFGNRLIEEVKN